MNIIAIIIIGMLTLLIGIGMGYWFADFTKIRDLLNQKAQLKARCEQLETIVNDYKNKDKKNYKMERLDKFDIENLTDNWTFYSLSDFIEKVEHECFVDDIGYGKFIYIDKDGTMYLKENEYFYPSEIVNLIKDNKIRIGVAEALREKYSNDEYKLFGIFWYYK